MSDMGIPMSARSFTEEDRATCALALDALDKCLECWVNGQRLTDQQGFVFTRALMAANRIINEGSHE